MRVLINLIIIAALAALVAFDVYHHGLFTLEMAFNLLMVGVVAVGYFLEHRKWGPDASELAKKTPAELREIAWRYQLKVSGKAGNTWERITFFGSVVLTIWYVLAKGAQYTPAPVGAQVMFVIGLTLLIAVLLAPAFVVSVPKLAAVIVTNFFTGRMHVLTPGINIRYPWERADKTIDQLSQRAGEVSKSSTFLSKDGIHVNFGSWMVQWGPFLPLLPLNIRYAVQAADQPGDDATVSETISEIVENTLYQAVLNRPVEGEDGLRSEKVTDEIENKLLMALEKGSEKGDKLGSTIEERNGVIIEIAALGPISFDKDYEEALVARKTVAMMRDDAKKMSEDLGIEGGQALDSVMIANKENVERKIQKIEIDQGVRDAIVGIGDSIAKAVRGATT